MIFEDREEKIRHLMAEPKPEHLVDRCLLAKQISNLSKLEFEEISEEVKNIIGPEGGKLESQFAVAHLQIISRKGTLKTDDFLQNLIISMPDRLGEIKLALEKATSPNAEYYSFSVKEKK